MASTVIERKSIVDAPAEDVWARIITPEGINDEMRPVMTMSIPRGAESFSIDNVPIGAPIGRAWLRLFGVLLFDYDDLVIAEVEPGQSFREESTIGSPFSSGRGCGSPPPWSRRASARCSVTDIDGCNATSPRHGRRSADDAQYTSPLHRVAPLRHLKFRQDRRHVVVDGLHR